MIKDIRSFVCDKCGKVCAVLSWDYTLTEEVFNNIEEADILCKNCFVKNDTTDGSENYVIPVGCHNCKFGGQPRYNKPCINCIKSDDNIMNHRGIENFWEPIEGEG